MGKFRRLRNTPPTPRNWWVAYFESSNRGRKGEICHQGSSVSGLFPQKRPSHRASFKPLSGQGKPEKAAGRGLSRGAFWELSGLVPLGWVAGCPLAKGGTGIRAG
jgi:hypothetical protein